MTPARRILLATDFSRPAEKALVEAVRLCREARAQLHVLHVQVPREQERENPNHPHWDHSPDASRLALDALVRDVRGYWADTCAAIDRAPSAEQGILRYARDHGIDTIVMGTHGWQPLRRRVLGSVARAVEAEAAVPVVAVGPRGR